MEFGTNENYGQEEMPGQLLPPAEMKLIMRGRGERSLNDDEAPSLISSDTQKRKTEGNRGSIVECMMNDYSKWEYDFNPGALQEWLLEALSIPNPADEELFKFIEGGLDDFLGRLNERGETPKPTSDNQLEREDAVHLAEVIAAKAKRDLEVCKQRKERADRVHGIQNLMVDYPNRSLQ